MEVKPGRPTWALWLGLGGVLLGERVFHDSGWLRGAFSTAGLVAVAGATLAGLHAWWRARGEDRRIARWLALAYAGAALGLAGFLGGTEDGIALLGPDLAGPSSEGRFRRGLWTLSAILLAISLLPMAAAQWALRLHGGERVDRHVDAVRVEQVASAALSVALAASFLMLTGYVASARNRTFDASYFKTSSPGPPVREIVGSLEQPLRVLLFFPEVDGVKEEVAGYFRALRDATGHVVIEEHDRFFEPLLAEEHRVTADGTVVLRSGERQERLLLPIDLDAARGRLRVLDGEAQRALLMLTRERRVLYLATGHGERNDPAAARRAITGDPPPATGATGRARDPGARASAESFGADPPLGAFRRLMGLLNYEVRELGALGGLGSGIPEDAAAVMVIGPRLPFLDEELLTLLEYLDRGGSLLLALEAESEFRLGPIGDRLGIALGAGSVVDDRRHLRQRGGPSDRRLILTDRISTHPSVRTASRQGPGSGVLFVDAGHLIPTGQTEGVRTRIVIESLPSSFVDSNRNLRLDEASETRAALGLAAAVEDSTEGGAGMRALVYADSDLFSDAVLSSLALNLSVVADGVRWLGREEAFSGETVSEEDVPIVHTRSEDAAWFYAIILGAPALVLGVGLAVVLSGRGARRPDA